MDKSLLIVDFKYVVSAVPDTSCELLPLCITSDESMNADREECSPVSLSF